MSAEPLLAVRGLVKHFGPVHAVDGVDLDVVPGETLGIVGESGSGKTTTARMIARLLEPTSGSIRFDGRDVGALRRGELKALRREVQFIFQDPYSSLNPRKPVGSIVGEPFAVHGLHTGKGERRRAVQELLEQVGLNPEHYNRYPHEFSGGQRQRVGIARALALRPKLILADEPVSALDVSIRAQVLNLLRDLQGTFGITLVLIAHDLSVVRHMCDRIAVMYLGKVVELAGAEALFAHPRHPYTGTLLSAVPVPDPDLARRPRQPPRGDAPSPTDPPPACRFHPRCPKCQEVCTVEEPLLKENPDGNRVACHFPLTDAEAPTADL